MSFPKNAGLAILKFGDLVLFLGFASLDVAYGQRGLRWNIGMLMGSMGIVLWGIAGVQLGKSFSATAQANALVTAGLDSKIRHPVYLSGALGHTGLLIAWGNWWLTTAFLALQSVQIRRIRREERILEDAFG